MPLARPCARPNRAPVACASAWLVPTKALENARPASVAALAMSVRAARSSGSSYTRGRASKISRAACTQNASVYGEAKIDTAASSAWVRASTPLSTVTDSGMRKGEHRVDDRHVGHQRVVDQRLLALTDGDDGGRGHLGAGAGRRGDRDQPHGVRVLREVGHPLARVEERQGQLVEALLWVLVEQPHRLGRVEDRAAADRDHGVWTGAVEQGHAASDHGLVGLRLDLGEDLHVPGARAWPARRRRRRAPR